MHCHGSCRTLWESGTSFTVPTWRYVCDGQSQTEKDDTVQENFGSEYQGRANVRLTTIVFTSYITTLRTSDKRETPCLVAKLSEQC
jgi:hypothetical protein